MEEKITRNRGKTTRKRKKEYINNWLRENKKELIARNNEIYRRAKKLKAKGNVVL